MCVCSQFLLLPTVSSAGFMLIVLSHIAAIKFFVSYMKRLTNVVLNPL